MEVCICFTTMMLILPIALNPSDGFVLCAYLRHRKQSKIPCRKLYKKNLSERVSRTSPLCMVVLTIGTSRSSSTMIIISCGIAWVDSIKDRLFCFRKHKNKICLNHRIFKTLLCVMFEWMNQWINRRITILYMRDYTAEEEVY